MALLEEPTFHPSITSYLCGHTSGTYDLVLRVCLRSDREVDTRELRREIGFVCFCGSQCIDIDLCIVG